MILRIRCWFMQCPQFYSFCSEAAGDKPICLLFPVAEPVLLHSSWRNLIQQCIYGSAFMCQAADEEPGSQGRIRFGPCLQKVLNVSQLLSSWLGVVVSGGFGSSAFKFW